MNLLRYITKIFCALSTFCCGQILYSQIPEEATFPLEMAELIGLKMCDDYTLSYFVMNVSDGGYNSYNHGIIEQNQYKKEIQSTKALDNYFNDFHNKKDGYIPSIDKFDIIDSIYPSKKGKNFQINLKERVIKYSDNLQKPHLISKDEDLKSTIINIKKNKGVLEKQWINADGEQMKNTILYDNRGRKTSDISESITQNRKSSINYTYGIDDLIRKVEHYKWSAIDTIPYLKTYDYLYASNNKLESIKEQTTHFIRYLGEDKIRVNAAFNANEYYMIDFFLDANGFILSYKYYELTTQQYFESAKNKSESYRSVVNEAYRLISHCLILCK